MVYTDSAAWCRVVLDYTDSVAWCRVVLIYMPTELPIYIQNSAK